MPELNQNAIHSLILSCFNDSNSGNIHFGQLVNLLLTAGIESYQIDYRAGRASYYLPDDTVFELVFDTPAVPIASHFQPDGISAAILAAQQGEIRYPEFKQLSQQAGCIGYIVWLQGRQVSYFGRNGEQHCEPFPT